MSVRILSVMSLLLFFPVDSVAESRHFPLYQRGPIGLTTIFASFRMAGGIKKIDINVIRGRAVACAEGGGLLCRENALSFSRACDFVDMKEEQFCRTELQFDKGELITYSATAETVQGGRLVDEEITFLVGPPLPGLAEPVWWHRSSPQSAKINVGFFAAAGEYSFGPEGFGEDLNRLLESVFFGHDIYSRSYTQERSKFNIWISSAEVALGSNSDCDFNVNNIPTKILTLMDAEVILHRRPFDDCAAISFGGEATVDGMDSNSGWIFVHESGHFLYGQGDEYCCDGGYFSINGCRNVFEQKADCDVVAVGSEEGCEEIAKGIGDGATKVGRWHVRVSGREIMAVPAPDINSNWSNVARKCMLGIFEECAKGSCFPKSAVSRPGIPQGRRAADGNSTSNPVAVDPIQDNATVLRNLVPGLIVRAKARGKEIDVIEARIDRVPKSSPISDVHDGVAVVEIPDKKFYVIEGKGLKPGPAVRYFSFYLPLDEPLDMVRLHLSEPEIYSEIDLRTKLGNFCRHNSRDPWCLLKWFRVQNR